MEIWVRTSLILCVFGFLKEFRPSDPFFTQYLVGPHHNYTEAEVNQQIYPVMTYSQLALLVVVFLVTDLLRYKPIILVQGISLIISTGLLVSGTNMFTMQVMSFFYGAFTATEVAYCTYIYAKVDRKHYQKVTSYTQTAVLLGKFLSSVVGQVLVSTELMDFHELNFMVIAAITLATLWSLYLPPVERSIYFHAEEVQENPETKPDKALELNNVSTILPANSYTVQVVTPAKLNVSQKWVRAFNRLWKDFQDALTNMYVLKWCIWWALATCGQFQVYLYMQVLWEAINSDKVEMNEEPQIMYNGAVDALFTIIGAGAAFACGWLRLNWKVLGEVTLACGALMQGACLIVAALTGDLHIAYVTYILFTVLYYTMITIVNAEIAKHINEDSYGLIFGVNTFFALVLQTFLTVIVAGEGGLALDVRPQFVVYGSYFVVMGAIFILKALVSLCSGQYRNQPLWLSKEPSTPAT